MPGPAAGAHVKAMRGKTGAQGGRGEAAHVARLARTFEAVHHDDFAQRFARRALRFHQHLDAGLGVYQAALNGKLRADIGPLPEVGGDGLEVRVAEERIEIGHAANL